MGRTRRTQGRAFPDLDTEPVRDDIAADRFLAGTVPADGPSGARGAPLGPTPTDAAVVGASPPAPVAGNRGRRAPQGGRWTPFWRGGKDEDERG